MKTALVLRPADVLSALRSISRFPRLALGFEASALSSFGSSSPAWVPDAGDTLPARGGDYTVLSAHRLIPGLDWPWLLCSKSMSLSGLPSPGFRAAGALKAFSSLLFASAAALCLREGSSRKALSENGDELRLAPPALLARAIASRGASPAPASLSSRLGFLRSSRARNAPQLRPEISAELASLLKF